MTRISAAPLPDTTVQQVISNLPSVREIRLRAWTESYGSDYYGALDLAAEYCGLPAVPAHLPGSWQHGTIPPWHMFRPEVLVYDAPRSMRCFVSRADEEALLRRGGYRGRAIGLPLIYTGPSGTARVPNSLLVMPTHSLPSDVFAPSCDEYVREIASIRDRFSVVIACVSAYCLERGLWAPQFAKYGIPVVRGAGISDGNALKRMRSLFDSFEYMTTDSYGSHVFYALYCGARVSIWGTPTPVVRENVLRDGGWTAYPDAVDKIFSPETERHAESCLGPLRVNPWDGVLDVELGKRMLGEDNRVSPDELRDLFGWTSFNEAKEAAKRLIRRSALWKVARSARHRLS